MKRILVVKLSSLGDIAHALPAVRALKERTGAAIDWVVQPEYAALLARCPDVERTIVFPRRNFARGFFSFWRALRREKYDVVVDLQGLLKSALAARLANSARKALSFSRGSSRVVAWFSAISPMKRLGKAGTWLRPFLR